MVKVIAYRLTRINEKNIKVRRHLMIHHSYVIAYAKLEIYLRR